MANTKNIDINKKLSFGKFWGVIASIFILIIIITFSVFFHIKNKQNTFNMNNNLNKDLKALNQQNTKNDDAPEITMISEKVAKIRASQEYAKRIKDIHLNGNSEVIPPIITNNQTISSKNGKATFTNEVSVAQGITTSSEEQHKQQQLQEYYNALKSAGKIQLSSILLQNQNVEETNKLKNSNDLEHNQLTSNKVLPSSQEEDLILEKSKGNYTLHIGSYIPATMDSELNSEIPGQVRAIVRSDVFDSVTHRNLLIPAGSSLVGKYDSNILYGQSRLLVAWTKLYYPNGQYINLKAQPATDMAGSNGLHDQVDNHYLKIWGSSFLIGTLTAAMQYSQNNTNPNVQVGGIGLTSSTPSIGQTLAGSLGQQLGQTGLQIIQKGLNIPPTIIIRRGYMFNIQTLNDIVLNPISGELN